MPRERKRSGSKVPTKWTTEVLIKLADDLKEWYKNPLNIVMTEFVADHDLNMDSFKKLYTPDEEAKVFRANEGTKELKDARAYLKHTVGVCKTIEESRFVKSGLAAKNAGMQIFYLKCKHGFQDKIVVAGDKDNPLVIKNVGIDGDKI